MKIQTFALVALACGLPAFCFAQSSPATSTTTTTTSTAKPSGGGTAPYTDGSVWTLSMIKTKTG
ncbi:MAG TPA: hypothetical protein VIU85_00190, partial [Chthoniobacterales bacterium]